MKLFDNLRKHIVHKLMRPEDGYTYTGATARFYQDIYTDQYILYVGHIYIYPTLTGWREYEGDVSNLDEISFYMWKIGILNNITSQYSERLDNLSQQELKSIRDYKRKENGDEFVMNKKTFCDIIYALDNYWENLHALEKVLDVYFEGNMLTDIFEKVIDALEEELEPQFFNPETNYGEGEEPLIMRWLMGSAEDIKTAGELYDYLIQKRDEKNISETP